jgi:hypothetical protein
MSPSQSHSSRRHADPFDDPHWLFELKHEGIRALAVVWRGHVGFLSETGRWLSAFPRLATAIKNHLPVEEAILDGSIAAPDRASRTAPSRLARRPEEARFYAFDLVWLNGQDRRAVPLLSRKEQLRELLPPRSGHLCGACTGIRNRVASAGLSPQLSWHHREARGYRVRLAQHEIRLDRDPESALRTGSSAYRIEPEPCHKTGISPPQSMNRPDQVR